MAFGGAVKLTGESEYRNALKMITQELRTLSSEMKVVATSYDKNDKSVTTLKSKQDDLNRVLEKQKTTLAQATSAYNSFNQKVAAQATEHQKLEKEYKDAVAELERIKQTSGEASDEYKEQAEIVADLAQKYKKSTDAQTQNEVSLQKLETQLNNAQTAVNGTERELDALEKELDQAENSTNELGDAMDEAGKSADNASGGFTVIKGVLANLISDGITTCISKLKDMAKQTIETGQTFDSSMSNVAAISGATGDDLDKLRNKAKEMGEKTKFSASEAADGLSYMAMAGWKTDDMLNGLDGIMNLAAASGADLATTSDIVTDALTAFGKSAEDSGRLADIMAATSSNANTNVELLGETFKYCASTAGSLGYSMEDTSVAIGLMANSGVKGSQAGTSLKNILVNLSKPTSSMEKAMNDLGISLTDNNGNMKSLDEVMGDLRGSFSKLDEKQKASYAATLAGKEGMAGLLAIVNASPKDFDKLTKAVNDSGGAAEKMAETMNDNLGGDLTLLNSHLESVQIAIYEKFEPALRKGVEILNSLLNAVQFVVDHSTEFIAAITAMAAGIAAYLAYTTAMTVMTQGWQALTVVTKAQAVAQAALNAVMSMNPIGIVIGLIAALVAAFVVLWNKSDAFRKFWTDLWDSIKGAVGPVVDTIVKTVTNLWDSIKSAFKDAANWFKDLWGKIKTVSADTWESIKSTVTGIIDGFKNAITTTFNSVKTFITTIWDNIKTITSTVWNGIKTAITTVINAIKTVITTVFNTIKTGVTTIWNAIKTTTSTVWNGIKTAVSSVVNGIKTTVSSVFNGIKTTVSSVWNGIKSTTTTTWNAIKTAIQTPINKARDLVKKAIDKIKGFFKFKISWPKIPMPHFSISPSGWKIGDLLKGKIPKLSIDWRKLGGVFDDGPTVLTGVGEDGAEAIVPLERNTKWIKRVASEMKPFLADSIKIPPINVDMPTAATTNDLNLVNEFKQALSEMKILLDDEKMGKFIDKTVSNKIYSV